MERKPKAVSMDDWDNLIKEEEGLFYVSTDLDLLVKNNRIGFSEENAKKIFDQAAGGFSAMLKDPKATQLEVEAARMSVFHLKILPFRYH
jgi:hypothetical protein